MTKAKSAQMYLNEIKDKLYGDYTVAKIWGVVSPALSQQEPPNGFLRYAPGEKYTLQRRQVLNFRLFSVVSLCIIRKK